jgi:hypothetical protein
VSNLLVIGDSVLWGQGLIDTHKSASLLADHLQAEMKMVAHSGANIGIRDSNESLTLFGEVPCSYPTILEQIQRYAGDAALVDWVLMNGGINDVDVRRILNPLHPQFDLERNTRKYCGRDMLTLLQQVMAKFPRARVLVLGYFPVLSHQSSQRGIECLFAAVHGVTFAPIFQPDLFRNALVDHCLRFWKVSDESLQGAVAQANQAAGTRAIFVESGIMEVGAAYAPGSLLWELDPEDPFKARDEVATQRHAACDLAGLNIFQKRQCHLVSTGHPNVAGAARIAEMCIKAARAFS